MRIGIVTAGFVAVSLLGGAALFVSDTSPAQQTVAAPLSTGASGLPLPRFVSLKSDRVNARQGPSRTHSVRWVFAKQGLPVEIIAEFDNWRQVRDSEGDEAWVFHSLLSGRRTALVAPWLKEGLVALREDADKDSSVVARVEPGVLGTLERCNGTWCRVSLRDANGWLPQESLWGVYPGEKFD